MKITIKMITLTLLSDAEKILETLCDSARLPWRSGAWVSATATVVPLLDFSPTPTMLLLPFPDGDRGRVVEHYAVTVPVIAEWQTDPPQSPSSLLYYHED